MMGTELFPFEESVASAMLKQFERDEESMDQDVKTVKEWITNQPHLPEILDNHRIRNFLLLNKCSIENTKQKIDMYYTIRSLIPDLFKNVNPKLPIMQQIWETIYWIPLPELTKNMYRVFIFKLRNKALIDTIEPIDVNAHIFNVHEIRMKEDRLLGEIVIVDLTDVSWGFLVKFTPTVLAKMATNYEKVYSMRLKAFYLVNSHPSIGKILAIAKTIIKPKIFDRVHVCQDMNVLFELVSKESIPSDYGGSGKSCEEIHELVRKKFDEYQERFDELDTLRVDESARPVKLKNDEVLGFHGNFKKLVVD